MAVRIWPAEPAGENPSQDFPAGVIALRHGRYVLLVHHGDRAMATGRLVRTDRVDWFQPVLPVAEPGRTGTPGQRGVARGGPCDRRRIRRLGTPVREGRADRGLGHGDRPLVRWPAPGRTPGCPGPAC